MTFVRRIEDIGETNPICASEWKDTDPLPGQDYSMVAAELDPRRRVITDYFAYNSNNPRHILKFNPNSRKWEELK